MIRLRFDIQADAQEQRSRQRPKLPIIRFLDRAVYRPTLDRCVGRAKDHALFLLVWTIDATRNRWAYH
jgi:hypothetical protein